MALINTLSSLWGLKVEGPEYEYAWRAINEALQGKWSLSNYVTGINNATGTYLLQNSYYEFKVVTDNNVEGNINVLLPFALSENSIIKVYENNGGIITENNVWIDAGSNSFNFTFTNGNKYIIEGKTLLIQEV